MKKLIKDMALKLIPERIKNWVLNNDENYNHLRNGCAQITYSQQGEDLEIERIFPDLKEGFYVDVGAFHPFMYSNTYKLYKKGWQGINIEPNPDQAELFRVYRPKDINLNLGVGSDKTGLKYYSFNNSAVNTFVETNAIAWAKVNGFKITSTKEIQIETLANILEKYLPQDKKIDLMNIDVEGMDMEVLKSNDWSRFRPHTILVEEIWNNKKSLENSEIYQYLYANNYSLWNIIGITMFFVDTLDMSKKSLVSE